MKITIIIILSLLAIMAIAQVFISRGTSQTEQHQYKILKTYDKFEVRKYEAALFSSVKMDKRGYKENSSEGFRILAGYIFGDNESNEKIAMTTPVAMELGRYFSYNSSCCRFNLRLFMLHEAQKFTYTILPLRLSVLSVSPAKL